MQTVRNAVRADLPAIVAIYNHAILHTVATFDTEPYAVEDRVAWFEQFGAEHPLIVLEDEGRVLGFAYYLPFKPRLAYAKTKEVTIYVAPDAHRRGVGTALYTELIARAKAAGLHLLIAVLGGKNEPSEALHAKFGFKITGHLPEAGWKFGRWQDVWIMSVVLGE